MNQWKYVQNGQTLGPVNTAQLQALLRTGTLPPNVLVWREGMPDWAAANTLPDFRGVAPADRKPPPPQSVAPAQPPLSDAEDIEKNKIYAVLAYVGLLFLVPLLAAPESKFARYHTNQGVVLFLASTIASFALMVLTFIPFVGCLAILPLFAVLVATLVLMILGIVNAASGQTRPLPLIGHYQLIK